MTENMTFITKLKKECSEFTMVQKVSYFLQIMFLLFCIDIIYKYQTGFDFEATFTRNTIDHIVFLVLGLVAFLWAKGLGDDEDKAKD